MIYHNDLFYFVVMPLFKKNKKRNYISLFIISLLWFLIIAPVLFNLNLEDSIVIYIPLFIIFTWFMIISDYLGLFKNLIRKILK